MRKDNIPVLFIFPKNKMYDPIEFYHIDCWVRDSSAIMETSRLGEWVGWALSHREVCTQEMVERMRG